jgi:hypothetical protein
MQETSSQRTFTLENGDTAYLKVFQPSKPYGVWPGADRVMRRWEICRKGGGSALVRCTKEEARALEVRLGEIERVGFYEHPTVGLVVCELHS